MFPELRQVVVDLNKNPDVCAVILTGSGKSFCARSDLRWIQKIVAQKHENRISESTELPEMLGELEQLKIPLIGQIKGLSFGGAVGLIAC